MNTEKLRRLETRHDALRAAMERAGEKRDEARVNFYKMLNGSLVDIERRNHWSIAEAIRSGIMASKKMTPTEHEAHLQKIREVFPFIDYGLDPKKEFHESFKNTVISLENELHNLIEAETRYTEAAEAWREFAASFLKIRDFLKEYRPPNVALSRDPIEAANAARRAFNFPERPL